MVSIAQGLKMMGGGEDLTGYGKTADWLSDRRPQKTALQQLMEMMAEKEDAPGSDIDGIGSDIGDIEGSNIDDTGGFSLGGAWDSFMDTIGMSPEEEDIGQLAQAQIFDEDTTPTVEDLFESGAATADHESSDLKNALSTGMDLTKEHGPEAIKWLSNVIVGNPDTAAGGDDFEEYVKQNKLKSAYNTAMTAALFTPAWPLAVTAEVLGEGAASNMGQDYTDDIMKQVGVDKNMKVDPDDNMFNLPKWYGGDPSKILGGGLGMNQGGRIGYDEGDIVADDPLTRYLYGKETLSETPTPDSFSDEMLEFSERTAEANRMAEEELMEEYQKLLDEGRIPEDVDLDRLLNRNADGGRVGMFLGGTTASGTAYPNSGPQTIDQTGIGGALTNLINQNPQISQQLQGLNQQNLPGQVQNQMYTPPQPQQPWNPYVNSNPFAGSTGFYDPSTLNMPTSNDPVMLGGPDPYQMYDPYTPSMPGAGRAQPLDTGPQPTGAPSPGYMLTPDEITEHFADTSKYSLEAQRLKSEEEARIRKEEESKKKRVHQGGEGGAGQW